MEVREVHSHLEPHLRLRSPSYREPLPARLRPGVCLKSLAGWPSLRCGAGVCSLASPPLAAALDDAADCAKLPGSCASGRCGEGNEKEAIMRMIAIVSSTWSTNEGSNDSSSPLDLALTDTVQSVYSVMCA